ncbi:MAG TPA: DUF4260 family protein [Sphingobacteriaceae bacterium]
MKLVNQIKIEEALMLLAAYAATIQLGYSWWLFFALLLLPDLSMLGYLAGNHIGAGVYNFFHNRAVAVLTGLAGVVFGTDELILAGIVLFGHIAMDRLLGYGLKYSEGFHATHLGTIGPKDKPTGKA